MPANIKVECPKCEWVPDGKPHWRCSCGYKWNTFETQAKCPGCGKQWDVTYCPGCGQTSPHKDWYVDTTIAVKEDEPHIAELKRRKRNFERRMMLLGINKYRITNLEYLNPANEEFRTAYESGRRLLILYAIAYCVHHLSDRQKIIAWFKRENLWESVSEKEKSFLDNPSPGQRELQDMSWGLEGALTLGWALNLFDGLHEINTDEADEEMKAFLQATPALGDRTKEFLENLAYRSLVEIYEENLVNELATAYFRDLFVLGGEDETTINRMASYERHKTLNWVRQFSGIKDWDKTDTST
jgi:hypothetical protein